MSQSTSIYRLITLALQAGCTIDREPGLHITAPTEVAIQSFFEGIRDADLDWAEVPYTFQTYRWQHRLCGELIGQVLEQQKVAAQQSAQWPIQ
jgi:hypothetical protein